MSLLRITDLSKSFGDLRVLDRIGLSLPRGQILCLLGPSGCGKTTLLRIIAGLEPSDSGRIEFDGRNLADLPPHRRGFGMMFQEFALFPHKNVAQNMAFGPEMAHWGKEATTRRVEEVLNLVGLKGFNRRDVSELSGGERQRVALARSICPNPGLLLLDEPMGALDRALRDRLMHDLRRILKRTGATTIFVTHDQAEAFAVADLIAVLDQSRLLQTDTPERVYLHPADTTVAAFLGFQNLIPINSLEKGVHTDIGPIRMARPEGEPGRPLTMLIRPDAARLISPEAQLSESESELRGVVGDRLFQGRCFQVGVVTDKGRILLFELPLDTPPPMPGQNIRLALRHSGILFYSEETPVYGSRPEARVDKSEDGR